MNVQGLKIETLFPNCIWCPQTAFLTSFGPHIVRRILLQPSTKTGPLNFDIGQQWK